MLGPDRFRFLNVEGSCSNALQWQGDGRSRLWAYNLHYFADLNARNAPARRTWHERLIERWIDENPPPVGIGWDSYPVSRRIVNWLRWSLGGDSLSLKAQQSLAVQARWLNRRIESHLQGNHVFANAKALVHVGLFFAGPEAERWLLSGLSLMDAEIDEQVLGDGGHFERSTMYHAGFLEDLLDTINIMRAYGLAPPASWPAAAARMMSWLEAMSHPDGGIGFFNDAAFGVFPTPIELRAYAVALNIPLEPHGRFGLRPLMPSGYVSIELEPFFLLCDVAPVGPDHLPAHAHADTLSFELSYKGRRVFVNSGTSEYGLSAERQRQRGTDAHNTVVIDAQNSSEVWAGFRVARRARARLLSAVSNESRITVVGEHDGYRRLRGRNWHRRRWMLSERELQIEDTVQGRFGSAMCYYHLHPNILVKQLTRLNLHLVDSDGSILAMRFDGAADVNVVASTWHPEFGATVETRCIVARFDGPQLIATIGVGESH